MTEYIINPVLMEGTVKERDEKCTKIHLRGRLGVITLDTVFFPEEQSFFAGDKVQFYFSYIQVVDRENAYDIHSLTAYEEVFPCLLGGRISKVNDTAVEVNMVNDLGTLFVPRRWVFTPLELKEGMHAEFYLSAVRNCRIE